MSFQAGMKKEKFKIIITQISKNKKKRSVKYKNKIQKEETYNSSKKVQKNFKKIQNWHKTFKFKI